jgi:hypothetical protein
MIRTDITPVHSWNHYLAEAEPDGEVFSGEGGEDGGESLLHVSSHLKDKEDQGSYPLNLPPTQRRE